MKADRILARALTLFDVTAAQLCGKAGRSRRLTDARQAVMWALMEAGYTCLEAGELMGRDHTTILYGRKAAAARAATDVRYAAKLHALLADLLDDEERAPTVAETVQARRAARKVAPLLRLWVAAYGVLEPKVV